MNIKEVTAVGKYFEKNPEKLEKYDFPVPSIAVPFSNVATATNTFYRAKEKLEKNQKQALEKWKILKNITIDGSDFISSGGGIEPSSSFRRSVEDLDTYEKFVKKAGKPEDPEQDSLLRKYYSAYRKDFLALDKARRALIQSQYERVQGPLSQKQSRRKGIHPESLRYISALINYYTSESRRRIPKEAKDALQKATVVANALPKVVYRGMFYDGNKIKDKEKFLKKWSPGSKPGVKFAKASSWSTSQSVAAQFMTAQDSVKNIEDGFAVMLRYTISDPKDVIADLRNLPEGIFWNQQEIILDRVTDYEVLYLIPGSESIPGNNDNALNKLQNKLAKPYAGGLAFSKRKLLLHSYFNLPLLDIPANIKEQWRTYAYLTAKQVKDKENIAGNFDQEYESILENLRFPLYVLINKNIKLFEFKFSKFIDTDSMEVSIHSSYVHKEYLAPLITKILGYSILSGVEGPSRMKDVGYGNHIIFDATITLAYTSGNRIDFVIKDVKNMRVERVQDPNGAALKDALKIQDALEKSPEIRKELLDMFRNSMEKWNASKLIAKFKV